MVATTTLWDSAPATASRSLTASKSCTLCGGSGELIFARWRDGREQRVTGRETIRMYFEDSYPDASMAVAVCPCLDEQIQRRRIASITGDPDIPKDAFNYNFSDFSGERYVVALPMAQQLARGSLVADAHGIEKAGLMLVGPTGTGKTTLVACIYRAWVERKEVCMWTKATTLIKKVQATYADHYNGVSGDSIIEAAAKAALLVIDDLGDKLPGGTVKAASDNRIEILYRVIDPRETRRLPTLITSNLINQLELYGHLGDRIVSRLRGLCHGVYIGGGDYRAPGDREEE